MQIGITLSSRSRAEASAARINVDPHPFAFVTRRHLGVREHDLAGQQIIVGNGEAAVAKVELEPVALRVVADLLLGEFAHQCDANTRVLPALSKATVLYGCGLALSIPGEPGTMPGTAIPRTPRGCSPAAS